ncbi:MAG: 5-(carboxyamino)imidazole ribonucleotide synthase [Micavibrio sp.]|nr:5-(carboxyamino)imidazole ribonucleotide synthase [Micavibrio sp.]|tara:strand:+ start:1843 stop:2919 length:1077 start_codon:yes stop_codon:yes gene_type:complete
MKTLTLGILGGGQLGRMSALAAANLGIAVHIFTPEHNSPASQVSSQTTVAPYNDETALKKFAQSVDIITYEFENIPVDTIRFLKTLTPVYPDEKLLEVSQDRVIEKIFLNEINIETTRWKNYQSDQSILDAFQEWKSSATIIKTTRFGYDGKGQVKVNKHDNINETVRLLNGDKIIEDIVDFTCEISMICARDHEGNIITYGPMLNEHKNHILHLTTVPAGISQKHVHQADKMIRKIAQKIDLKGVLTLELFLTKDGRLLANEIAPRTHNSGHWSMNACLYSQFDNHIRAVCGFPVMDPQRHSDAKMLNLIGEDILDIDRHMKKSGAYLHIYGKSEIREGRKMGHINFISPKTSPTAS